MAESFLQIRGLKKHFGTKRVLDGIDLEIARASVTTLIGKSGIGKSVFLKCIANLMTPDAGEVLLDGVAIGNNRRGADQSDGFTFSYMFQNNALFDSLTAHENVALPLREAVGMAAEAVDQRVEEILKQLDLGGAGSRYPAELSGGMQKRVALARALVTNPEVVLFDEPTTGLDPERKFGVFDMIADYRERFGFTALLVSHDIPEVFEISDKVAWLDEGKIRFFGDPSELAADSPRSWSGLLQSTEEVETNKF
ncbi:MAG: Glutamine transport ATP-binding protein GlnQ [Opitutia bacterium UBA7350]|nr:MAG: Glutamine transport ATP-binding protein GlnQ [Opitutae bacterium UBA7350]